MTVSGTTVPQPVRVLPPHDAPGNPPERHLAEGQELVLETGTTLVAAPETVIELRNEGSAPTSMLDLLWITPSTSSESGGAMWGRATNTKRQELAPPISVVLWHLNVEAGATIPPPASESTAQSAAALDPKRIFNLRPEPDGSIRNTSDAPLEVYLLNVSGTPATPVAGT